MYVIFFFEVILVISNILPKQIIGFDAIWIEAKIINTLLLAWLENQIMESEETESAKLIEKIEILSTDNEKIKLIGELLSNDSSRIILQLLFESEMTANQISLKTNMLVSLIIHHLKKMQEVGIVKINRIEKNTKGHDMKYYGTTKFAIVILPSKLSDKARQSKSLYNSFRRIYKFAAIGITAATSWLILKPVEKIKPDGTFPVPFEPTGEQVFSQFFWSIVIPLIIITTGLIIERIMTARKLSKI